MSAQQGFTPDEMVSLKHYVYFLQDPKCGEIFYVGVGEGNGVLEHIEHAHQKEREHMRLDMRLDKIRGIEAGDQQVLCFIARHGMDEKTAQEVKGALIDIMLYKGQDDLTYEQRSKGSRQRGLWDFQGLDEDKMWGAPAENYKQQESGLAVR